jgi:hypothetical protein
VSPGASLQYQIEVTADPQPSPNGNWGVHDTLFGLTAGANGNVAFPVSGLRLNVISYSSGSVAVGVCVWP